MQLTKEKIEKILEKFPELTDLTLRFDDEDKDAPCFFATYPQYENKEMQGTYHRHDFTIQVNHHRLWICEKHFQLLMDIADHLFLKLLQFRETKRN